MKKMSRRVTSDVEKKFRLIIKARGERCYSLLAARSGPVWKAMVEQTRCDFCARKRGRSCPRQGILLELKYKIDRPEDLQHNVLTLHPPTSSGNLDPGLQGEGGPHEPTPY